MNDKDLHDLAVEIVQDYSGGIKFTELLTVILSKDKSASQIANFPDKLEKILRDSDKIKVLDYTHILLNRAKMFIYTS